MAKRKSQPAEETPMTKTVKIQGYDFEVSTPYEEGHTCSAAEAKALNQVRLENIRNNMAKAVKAAAGEDGSMTDEAFAEVAAKVEDYDKNYEFTLASVGGGRVSRDPVEVEARRIAKAAITSQLKAAGRKLADIDKDKLDAAIAEIATRDAVRAQAEANVKARNAVAEESLETLDL